MKKTEISRLTKIYIKNQLNKNCEHKNMKAVLSMIFGKYIIII